MMRFGNVAVPVLLLAALLTWVMLNASGDREAAEFKAQRTLEAIALAESRLKYDVLRARAGLLRNYDPIVALVADLKTSVAALERVTEPGDANVRAIATAVSRQAKLVERFTTANALVQNSIAFFDSLSERLADPGVDPRLSASVASLQIRVSEYVRKASKQRLEDIQHRLEALAQEHAFPDQRADIESIGRHGRQLFELMPKIDAIGRALAAASTEEARQGFAAAQHTRGELRESRADRYRLALYLIALALVALLVRIGLEMRASRLALRKTVEFQVVVAKASSEFLAMQPDEIATRIVEVLGMLTDELGTDHGYLLRLDGGGEDHLWNRPGLSAPTGWPTAQRAMIPDITASVGHRVIIDVAAAKGPQALLAPLAARGVTAWSCICIRSASRVVGLLCFERSTSPLPDWLRRPAGVPSVLADIFGAALERQRTWEERRAIEAELRRAQRLEAIGTFTSGVAHNINNVLNVMLGHAEIASEALPPESRAARQVEQLMRAGGRAREIANQILDFGRRGRSTQQTSSVDAVAAETVSQIRSSMAEPVTIRFDGTADGASVSGDPAQLQQIFFNLIRNAAQASQPGNTVSVDLDLVILAQRRTLSHGALPAGAFARLSVADTGRGMDEATQARIFEPFFTTRPEGTGLGLATAFEFVHERNGAFDVRSALGRGSTFEVWLPVVAGAEHQSCPAVASGTVMIVGNGQSLVLEDEEMLAALGFEPVGFADADAALSALHAGPARFDLLIVESRLAASSGFAFARKAAEVVDKPIVLSVTSFERIDDEALSAVSVVDVVHRPWRSNALAATLSRHLAPAEA